MSERAKREDTLDRLRKEHADIDEQALTALAIRADEKAEKISGIKWIVSGAVILGAGLLLTGGVSLWLLLAVVCVAANGVRLILNGPGIAQRYRSRALPEEGGLLTRERIAQECSKGLRITEGRFYLVKAPLHDMSVDADALLSGRKFYFRSNDGVYSLAVKRDQYRTAALDTQYYLVFPKSDLFREQIPLRAYQADSWELSEELLDCFGDFPTLPRDGEQEAPAEKPKKLLPGLSMALSFLSMWVPLTVSPLLCVGAVVLAAVCFLRARNGWTATALVMSLMSTAVMLMLLIPLLLRG